MTIKLSRRALLLHGLRTPVATGFLFGISGCDGRRQSHVTACADPSRLSESEASMRAVTHYTETSPDPQQVCAGCAFFRIVQGGGGCAPCDIQHGQVNAQGHCDSWSAKA